jgi:23S rRNA (guanosine2251-2'-O)-methyltransferase
MAGAVSSLNVSAAGAVVLYEAARQRRSRSVGSFVQEPVPRSGSHSGVQPKKQKGLGS